MDNINSEWIHSEQSFFIPNCLHGTWIWTRIHTQLFTWTGIFHLYSKWLLIQNENAHTSVYFIPFHSGVPNSVVFGIMCLYGKCIPIQSVYRPSKPEWKLILVRPEWNKLRCLHEHFILNEQSFWIQVKYICPCNRSQAYFSRQT